MLNCLKQAISDVATPITTQKKLHLKEANKFF